MRRPNIEINRLNFDDEQKGEVIRKVILRFFCPMKIAIQFKALSYKVYAWVMNFYPSEMVKFVSIYFSSRVELF